MQEEEEEEEEGEEEEGMSILDLFLLIFRTKIISNKVQLYYTLTLIR